MQRSRAKGRKVQIKKKNKRFCKPIENALDLATLARIELEGRSFSCFLLANPQGDLSTLAVKFVWKLQGFNPVQSKSDKFEQICGDLERYFQSINSTVTFSFESFCDSAEDISQSPKNLNKPLGFLYHDKLIRKRELIKALRRKKLNLYLTATFKPDTEQKSKDWLDKTLEVLGRLWFKKLNRRKNRFYHLELTKILRHSFTFALRQEQALREAGLKPSNLAVEELCAYLAKKLGTAAYKYQTRVLVLNKSGLQTEFINNSCNQDKYHFSTQLVGKKVPFADRKYVYLPGIKKYIGVMLLEQKPGGFLSYQHLLQYLWNIFSRQEIHDIELVTELAPANTFLTSLELERQTYRASSGQKRARDKGRHAVGAEVREEQSLDARLRLVKGDVPRHSAVVLLVYRNTTEELDAACRHLTGILPFPAKLVREEEYAWLIWLQTTGLKKQRLLYHPFDRSLTFFASEAACLCNLTQNAQADTSGLELIAHQGGSPVYIDFSKPKNILVLATTGGGKSLLLSSFILECQYLGVPFILLDLPNPDGIGTFKELVLFLGGVYFDISRESNNILQLPSFNNIGEDQEQDNQRKQDYIDDVVLVLNQLVLGSASENDSDKVKSLIRIGLEKFYQDPKIRERFQKAQDGGLGSSEWADTPTLADLMQFYYCQNLGVEASKANTEALGDIRLRLQYWLTSPLGRAIGRPSTFDTANPLIAFALTNLNSQKDAAIIALSAYLASKRLVLSYPHSAFFMDEASILLRFEFLSILMGNLCATARRQGCRVIIAGQDSESIYTSAAGQRIIQNTPCRLVGLIRPGAGKYFTDHLEIPETVIGENENFQLSKSQFYTRWLLSYQNSFIHCRYYPSFNVLALTGNSREEVAMREEFKKRYPDKYQWVTELAKTLKLQQ